jgi:hypothetical protein
VRHAEDAQGGWVCVSISSYRPTVNLPHEAHECASSNINVFGFAFIVTFACIVTILDLCVLRFFIYLSHFRRALAPRIDQWIQDGVWQLQRRAYVACGEGTWSQTENEVPVTNKHEQLGVLSVHGVVRMLTPSTTNQSSQESPYDTGFQKKDGVR